MSKHQRTKYTTEEAEDIFLVMAKFWLEMGLSWPESKACALTQMWTQDFLDTDEDLKHWETTRRACA